MAGLDAGDRRNQLTARLRNRAFLVFLARNQVLSDADSKSLDWPSFHINVDIPGDY